MTDTAPYVVVSHLEVEPVGADVLEAAFRDRLGEVDGVEGFIRLEVWQEEGSDGRYTMVSWWRSPDDFRAYMRSEAHRRSHARIPTEPARPRGVAVRRYRQIAT